MNKSYIPAKNDGLVCYLNINSIENVEIQQTSVNNKIAHKVNTISKQIYYIAESTYNTLIKGE